ncbi:MAG: hypothetical protein AAFU72_11280, partial [Pseudomonadota bacterium]
MRRLRLWRAAASHVQNLVGAAVLCILVWPGTALAQGARAEVAPAEAPLPLASPARLAAPAGAVGSSASPEEQADEPEQAEALDDRAAALQRLADLLSSPAARRVVIPADGAATPGAAPSAIAQESPGDLAEAATREAAAQGPSPPVERLEGMPSAPMPGAIEGGPTLTCLSTDALPGGLWRDLVDAAALATLSEAEDAPRDGPESAAELRRLAAAADALVERPVDPVSAAVFAGMLSDCRLAEATVAFIADAAAAHEMSSGAGFAPMPLAEGDAWARFSTDFLAAPETLREELAFRLAAAFVEVGAAEALALIEPHAVSADEAASRLPRRALIEAELAYARGDRPEALEALRSLAGPQHSARQAAAILLAERLEPELEMPIAAGWLAHIDLVGSIALEAAGSPLGERAALAEVRLSTAVLGPAEGLRRLSLAHQRGLISTAALETVAARIEAGQTAEAPIPVAVLKAYEPESFVSLDARESTVAPADASERNRADALPAAVEEEATPRPSPGRPAT